MGLQLVMRITLLLLLIYGSAEAEPPIAKPGCAYRCGDLKIPYPFGIGSNCYFDEWFEVVCNESFNPPRAIIRKIDMEVLEFNFTRTSTVRVKSPIISSNCTNMTTTREVVDIKGSPFFFSVGRNRFTAVGCDNFATMTDIEPTVVGCQSDCKTKPTIENRQLNCSGFNCCQTTIPSNLQIFNASLERIHKDGAGFKENCKAAFLVEEDWFESNNITDPSSMQNMDYVPVVLDWAIYNLDKLYFESDTPTSGPRNANCHSTTSTTSYYYNFYTYGNSSSNFCRCYYGYEGNPYLSTGCEDINECEDPRLNRCTLGDCENLEGSYTCNFKRRSMKMVIVGISTSLGVLILLLVIWWLYKVIKKRNEIKLKKKFFKKNGGLLLQQQLSSSEGNIQSTKIFNSEELEQATDHFNENRILGHGGQGTVYKGMLVDGRIVAIKKSKIEDEVNLEQFANEIVILSQVNHRNVVKLLGCCLETEIPLLVYEFIPNGTLFQYLHDENEEFPLTWDVRLRIATEVAGALSYLHSSAALPIYHRDIKSTNILLDDKYRAKIADFGTSKSITIDQTHLTTLVHGTFGYLDPEYFQTSQFTDKSDVYSFGVVLVELLTGEKPVSSTRSQEGRSLTTYFILSIKENHLFDILDARVKNGGKKEQIMAVANLAKRCLNWNGKKRPTMRDATMELEEIQKASNIQQNYEEFEYVRTEETEPWDLVSTSTRSGLESDIASSSDALPLLSLKSL